MRNVTLRLHKNPENNNTITAAAASEARAATGAAAAEARAATAAAAQARAATARRLYQFAQLQVKRMLEARD
ncbi:hypothetical protein Emag_003330 [Eimeria magna]